MILRIEKIDSQVSVIFAVDKIPKEIDLINFDGNYYQVLNVIEFRSHTLALVKDVNVLNLYVSQMTGVNSESE